MSTEEQMNINERRKYLKLIQKRYERADKVVQGMLLNEMMAVTGLHRKSLIRLMGSDLKRKPRVRYRGHHYGLEVKEALRVISESLDHVCAERLQPNLEWLALHLARHGELEVCEPLLVQLRQISISTVKRILGEIHQDEPHLPRRKPAWGKNTLTGEVPMRQIAWDEPTPGHFEVDIVHHCGPDNSGQYVHSLHWVDVATGWSERAATLGRGYRVMEDAFQRILIRLPFPVLELHPDNGSEFFNDHLMRFFRERVAQAHLSRSRPYRKNDNRFVEQKNSTLIRDPLGYERFDTVDQTLAINQLYDLMWLYYNFFQPVMRVTEKILLPANGRDAHITRRYDRARTPLDRLCDMEVTPPTRKQHLLTLRDQINPRRLRQAIYDQIEYIFHLPPVESGVVEDVHRTLAGWQIACSPQIGSHPFSEMLSLSLYGLPAGQKLVGREVPSSAQPSSHSLWRSGRSPALPYPPPVECHYFTRGSESTNKERTSR